MDQRIDKHRVTLSRTYNYISNVIYSTRYMMIEYNLLNKLVNFEWIYFLNFVYYSNTQN